MGPKRRKGILGSTFLKCPAILEQLSKDSTLERLGKNSATYKAVQAFNKKKQKEQSSSKTSQLSNPNKKFYNFSRQSASNVSFQNKKMYNFKLKKRASSDSSEQQGNRDSANSNTSIFSTSSRKDSADLNTSSSSTTHIDSDTQSIPSDSQESQDFNENNREFQNLGSVGDHSSGDEIGIDSTTTFKIVKVDALTAYELELRKTKKVIPIDDHFLSVVIPDFDEKKSHLTDRRFVCVSRKAYFAEEETIRWLYGCTCSPFEKKFIESLALDTDYVQEEKDTCLHIKVSRKLMEELESWEENEDPFDLAADLSSKTNEVSDIDFCDKVLVVVNGSAGVVSNNGTKLICCVCDSPFCCHCNYMRTLAKNTQDQQPFIREFLESTKTMKPSTWKQSVSWKRIPYEPKDSSLLRPPMMYLSKVSSLESVYCCEDNVKECGECSGSLVVASQKQSVLVCKSYYIHCKVINKRCQLCKKDHLYDGSDQCILNMGKFLIHHSVLRDYMLHFLHGNSCTIHGYYQVMAASQEHNEGKNMIEIMNYNDFRCSWYSFLSLLDISLEENSECEVCGKAPDIVVCDATGLGHQKKFLALGLSQDEEESVIPRTSSFKARVAIDEAKLRENLKKWSLGTLKNCRSFTEEMRVKYRSVYNIMKWSTNLFSRVVDFPRSLVNIFQLLSSPSPVCSYIPTSSVVSELLLKMLTPNIKADSELMKKLQVELPFFHALLSDLEIESSLPDEWKGVLLHLSDCAQNPFVNAQPVKSVADKLDESQYSNFPNLPILRKRGSYAQDKITKKPKECRKNYQGHPNLTSGIFTVYCIHGICVGFQVMDKEESPNIPFTVFRTRFPKAPSVIIYDNACNLHNYCLNRDPLFFQNTKFLVDRFHWKNHTACSLGYCMKNYVAYRNINSEVNEQQNARTKKLKTQLSYMTPHNFMKHCQLFFWFRNRLSLSKLQI